MKRILLAAILLALPLVAQRSQLGNPPKPETRVSRSDRCARAREAVPKINVDTITTRLNGPWSLAFLPDGNFLVTEAPEPCARFARTASCRAPIAGVPPVKVVAAQGLHDVALDPDFVRNRMLYITYFAPPRGRSRPLAQRVLLSNGLDQVARGTAHHEPRDGARCPRRLSDDNKRLENLEVLIDGGGERRIVIAPDGKLLVTGADRFRFYDSDLDGVEHDFTDNPDIRRNFSGRVIRINRDGSIPKTIRGRIGQPCCPRRSRTASGIRRAPRSIQSRASFGLRTTVRRVAMKSTSSERGKTTAGRTFLRRSIRSAAHGRKEETARGEWPRQNGGRRRPVYFWVPSIAPSGMMFHTGSLFPEWKGNLFVGSLAGTHLVRLVLDAQQHVAAKRCCCSI